MKKNHKLRIFFDANSLIGKKSGVGYYAYYLIENLAIQYPDTIELVGHYFNFLNRKTIPPLPTQPNITYRPSFILPAKIYLALRKLKISIPIEVLGKGRFDHAIFPNYFTTTSIFPTNYISIIHDLTFKLFPETVEKRNLKSLNQQVPLTIKRTSLFVANSQTVKKELHDTFNIPLNNIVVVYPLIELPPKNPKLGWTKRLKSLNSKKYILFVSTIEPRKNITTLVDAYLALPATVRASYSLVLAGGVGWNNDSLINKITKLTNEGYDIKLLGYVSEKERQKLYQSASLFVMPALYEGFGMTVLEAFQYNIPCITSDIPIFRELSKAKGNITYYSPVLDHKILSRKIQTTLQKPSKSISCDLTPFSWRKSVARLYIKINT